MLPNHCITVTADVTAAVVVTLTFLLQNLPLPGKGAQSVITNNAAVVAIGDDADLYL